MKRDPVLHLAFKNDHIPLTKLLLNFYRYQASTALAVVFGSKTGLQIIKQKDRKKEKDKKQMRKKMIFEI